MEPDCHQIQPIDSLIFIVLVLNKIPQMLLRDVPSLTYVARWAGSYNSY